MERGDVASKHSWQSLSLSAAALALMAGLAAAGAGQASASTSHTSARWSSRVGLRPARSRQTPSSAQGDLVTYDYNNVRSGDDGFDPKIRNLSSSPAWDDRSLSGAVYGEPLVYDGIVYVATEGDTVYALAARTGKVIWHLQVGTSVSTSVVDSAPTLGSGCGDIDPLGITGTPVIDPTGGEIFVAEETQLAGESGWQGIRFRLVAISITTPHVLWERTIDPPHANESAHYYIPAQQQRPALTLANGRVYVDFGGLDGDCGQYHGYVVALSSSGSGPLLSYQVPTSREGAIWGTDGGVVSAAGDIYVATGNGSSNSASDFDEGDSVIELSPTLKRIGYFAPSDWLAMNENDWDLGSSGPIEVPGTSLLFEAGKPASSGDYGYLVREGHLGGIGHSVYTGQACPGGGDFGADASDVVGGRIYIYLACGGGTEALRVTTSPVAFHRAWSPSSGSPNGSPIVAGGLVWALDWSNNLLYGMSPTTGHVVVERHTDQLVHFVAPGVGDKMLFVPTSSGVEAFDTVS